MAIRRATTTLVLGVLLCTCLARAGSPGDVGADGLTGGAPAAMPPGDPRLGAIGGSQELYDLAQQVMSELVQRYGGDPEKMNQALARAKNDPEGFAKSLSPATRARLKALANKVPDPDSGR
jgi:hypothetical protein